MVLALLLLPRLVVAENWPMWRGPRGDGTSTETNIPLRWGPTENIAWRVAIPGQGHASPIIWEDHVFVVTCVPQTEERILLCLDRKTGATRWQQTVVRAPLENLHPLNSRASSTPATDGQRVYVTFLQPDGTRVPYQQDRNVTPGHIVVAAYDFDGRQQWKVRPGRFSSIHGFCSHPVLFEDMVIVNGDHDGDAYLVALDRATGQVRWKVDRENKTRSYSTPLIRQIGDRTQMILSGSMCVASYDPRDGSRHWIIDGPTEQFVASVVYNGQLVFMTAGFPDRHILAIRPDGHGNVTDSHIQWRTTRGCAYVPSPVVIGPYFLVVADNGVASCFEANRGRRLWLERLGKGYSSSLVAVNGLVYFTSDDGITTVIRPGEALDVVAKNEIGQACSSSFAVSQGQLLLRGQTHLFCIGR
jgi:outer membrane protein assembly factor BamB